MSTQPEPAGGTAVATLERRVSSLEGQIGALIEAVEVLASGFEDSPIAAERSEADQERAARRAHELLLLVKASRQETGT